MQYVAKIKKPDGERLAAIPRCGAGQSLKFQMLSPAPIYPSTEKLFMTTALKLAEEKLGKDDAYVQAILQGGERRLDRQRRWWTEPSWPTLPSASRCSTAVKQRWPHPPIR